MVFTIRQNFLFPFTFIAIVAVWSAIEPFDLITWVLEVAPIIAILAIIIASSRRFPLTTLSYWLLALGSILVFIGAHYTYARMPVFEWIKIEFHLERNHYDRFGHFFQGFVPAIIFRELLLRTSSLRRGAWLFIVVMSMCMAKSVFYEFAEWWTTVALGEKAHEFLAMQGDEWDAQKDVFWATIGSIVALVTLVNYHDRQLARLQPALLPSRIQRFLQHFRQK